VTLYGDGRAALRDDRETAERLGWGPRRRSLGDPEIVLAPRAGDPRREPWIAPPWLEPAPGVGELFRPPRRRETWSYLQEPPGVLRHLDALARPRAERGLRVGLVGVGRVGGIAAAVLAATPVARSGVRELLIYDVDSANCERWMLELGSVADWHGGELLPRVRPTTLAQVFNQCDVLLFAATCGVPPLGSQGDVRLVQFEPNRSILRGCLEHARMASFVGLFLVISDPVDWLCQAAVVDSNTDPAGRFVGDGLAPERIAGLGLGVMWGRALAFARREGWDEVVARHGAAFGPHSTEVVVFDDVRRPSPVRSDGLTRAAREGNSLVRHLGFLPFVGPGVSSVALTLTLLLAGRGALASVFVDGVYLGCPARHDWGVYPAGRRVAPDVVERVGRLHGGLRQQAYALGLALADS
jgi:hypothetical protein